MMEGEILQRVRELERQVKVLLELHPDARSILSSATASRAGMSFAPGMPSVAELTTAIREREMLEWTKVPGSPTSVVLDCRFHK